MNKTVYKNSLKFDVLQRISQIPGTIILRSDIQNMAGARQISRSLRSLVEMGELIKLGQGVYAKTSRTTYLDRPMIQNGFDSACKEALNKLGVEWEAGQAEKAYNAGLSTQVPVRTQLRLKSRFRRRLMYGNRILRFEGNTNAR